MTVLLVLFVFILFLTIDWLKTRHELGKKTFVFSGTMITSPGFEMLGALAQDGGERIEKTADETFEHGAGI